MLAEAVLVTRLLGLMTGTRTIEAQVDANIRSVEIVLDGQKRTTLRGAPWRTTVDFGAELAPHELTAVARDAEGREIGSDTQMINLARPHAELGVMFTRREGKLLANIRWQHIGGAEPVSMTVKLGRKVLAKKVVKMIALPESDSSELRVLDVEAVFSDGSQAEREVVFGGIYSEQLPAELTATIVRQRAEGRTDLGRCFQSEGEFVQAQAVDAGEAEVLFVRAVNPGFALHTLMPLEARERIIPESALILPHATMRFVWPAAATSGDATLFSTSRPFQGIRGVRWALTHITGPPNRSARLIDAVAVAGTEALREPRRRVVVVVIGRDKDESAYSADVVKRYLARIGVPLHVWSLNGAAPHPVWGPVEDISTSDRLRDAVNRLKSELDQQRVAWLPLDPYRALRVEIAGDCAWSSLS